MSVPDNDISKFNNGDDDVNDDDDDRHEGVGVSGVHHGGGGGRRKQKLKNFRYGFRRSVAKAKKVVLSPINYLLPQSESKSESKSKSNKNPNLKNPSLSNQTGDDHRRIEGFVNKNNSCFCFIMQNQNFKSSSSSTQSPDCNDSKFTFDMLKALVESNDFYAKECNPHLDSITPSS